MRTNGFRMFVMATALACTASVQAQTVEADPVALKAFAELIKSYRSHPALHVKSTVEVSIKQGDNASNGSKVECDSTFAPARVGVVKLRGYTCYLNEGKVTAVHEKTDHSYYVQEDDGSPYYALMSLFMDLPFP